MKQYVFEFTIDSLNKVEHYLDGVIENKYKIQNVIISEVNGYGITKKIVVICRKRILGIF